MLKLNIRHFLAGMGSVLEIFPRSPECLHFEPKKQENPWIQDAKAIASDWAKVIQPENDHVKAE